MLLLPQTPTLIYLKLKKNKGPKMDSLSLHFTFTFHFHKHGGRRSIAGMAQHSITISIKKAPFQRNSLNIDFSQFSPKNGTAFIFTKEIPLKMNRTNKKKVRQKTEIAFNFIRKIPIKIFTFNFI